MTPERIGVEFSRDQALVLYEWVCRFNKREGVVFDDQAEQRVLWDIEASLESSLDEPFNHDYVDLLDAARGRVRDSGTGAGSGSDLEATRLPTPDDPADSPVWENYIIAQTVEASRGQIPVHALAVGVEVDGARVTLRFQVSELEESDSLDISEIVSELAALVGSDVDVSAIHEIRNRRSISPDDGICWVFLSRA